MKVKKLIKKLLRRDLTYQEKLKKKGLKYGENFSVEGGVIIDDSHCWLIDIGDNVTLAPRVHILAHDASTKKFLGFTRIGRVRIGSNVFVGANSIILPGIQIGDNVIIGAGTVVTKNVPAGSVVVGNPARFIKSTSIYLEEQKDRMTTCRVFDESYKDGRITNEMKTEMINALNGSEGYIV